MRMLHNFRCKSHINDQIADIRWQDLCLDISNQPMRTLYIEHRWAAEKNSKYKYKYKYKYNQPIRTLYIEHGLAAKKFEK